MRKLFFTLFLGFATNSIFAANEVRLMPKECWTMSDDGQFAYATMITEDSITLQVELFSPHMKMRSQTAGLMAYIDLTGKKKEKYAVAFPVVKGFAEYAMGERRKEQTEHQPKEGFDERQREAPDERRPQRRGPEVDFDSIEMPATVKPVLTGDSYASLFVNNDEQMLSPDDVTLAYTEGRLFYTLSLPLSKFGNKRNKKKVFTIAIGLRETAMQMPPMGEGMTPPNGGMGGPGGGMGGPGGGMGGPGGGERNAAPRKQQSKQWIEVKQD